MKTIYVVEDNKEQVEIYKSFFKRYEEENKDSFDIHFFMDGMEFIDEYDQKADIVFMDIAMPNMNGMEAATKLRKIDDTVCLIFITTLAQYAIKGYEVDALDFLVKPVSYELFSIKLKKALSHVNKHENLYYQISNPNGMTRVYLKDIIYVESNKHYLDFHTLDQIHRMRGSMDDIKDFFCKNSFTIINRSLMVNLIHVEGYTKNDVKVTGGELLPLSRVYKDELFKRLATFLGGTD